MMPANKSAALSSIALCCTKCGATIADGFCGACLLEEGLHLLAQDDLHSLGEADFGDYELLGEIGRGGQGVVFRARQKSLNRIVALKVIGLWTGASETHLKRFRREAEAAASLEHPGIVPIYDVGEHDGACFYSMQLIEGGQLDEFVRREPLPLRRAVEIIARLAHTVHYAHERGVLHRDIKPGNILLDAKGEPQLADFGLARLVEMESTVTRTRDVLGTPSYIAPEHAAGKGVESTSATDVYGLGAVFYQLLTGHPPFAGGTTYETIRLVLETEPRPPKLWNAKVDHDLATICLKCLEKDPTRRYPSALALAEDLERWLGYEPIQARPSSVLYRGRKWIRRNPSAVALCSLGAVLLSLLAFLFLNREPLPPPAGIAVLPFTNLDGDKRDTVFADGIQDDILTRLSSIADLKVISRTSVMNYRGKLDPRQISDALHVSHLLEGTVRRDGNSVRLNIQLIDAHTNQQIWSEEYNRALDDVNVVQGDIAQAVAEELHLKLSRNEKRVLAQPPTKDLQAYDFYVCGTAILDGPTTLQDDERSIEFFNKALARDPNFLLAYCELGKAYDFSYVDGDHTPECLAKANAAIQAALRLSPQSGEAHLTLARHLNWCLSDYARAQAELEIARRTLPNDARIASMAGAIDCVQGRWPEAVRERERAAELDPRNKFYLRDLGDTYWWLRDYEKADRVFDRALALDPDNLDFRLRRACLDIGERGDVRPAKAIAEKILDRDPGSIHGEVSIVGFCLSLYAHDFPAAGRAWKLIEGRVPMDLGTSNRDTVIVPNAFFDGWISELNGDAAAARVSFLAARREQEKNLSEKPDSPYGLCALGAIDAQLGRKEDALREGRRAMELMPLTKDAIKGADVLYCFALICTWSGERDLAFTQLEKLAKIPVGPAYGELLLDPSWDSLRDDRRFGKILDSLPHRK